MSILSLGRSHFHLQSRLLLIQKPLDHSTLRNPSNHGLVTRQSRRLLSGNRPEMAKKKGRGLPRWSIECCCNPEMSSHYSTLSQTNIYNFQPSYIPLHAYITNQIICRCRITLFPVYLHLSLLRNLSRIARSQEICNLSSPILSARHPERRARCLVSFHRGQRQSKRRRMHQTLAFLRRFY